MSVEQYLFRQVMRLPDYSLKIRFKLIVYQCKYWDRSDDSLLLLQNELEFRNIRYRR